ncbi:XAC2610-related protein [Burkholderia ubonensis]|uniref:XAC2610-related protein n=1 Tax=Burkholderia ubonensis TaxID=101571 RepID=UPI000B2F4945|nr:hypothetical protein [Burkholderia ubonensis]
MKPSLLGVALVCLACGGEAAELDCRKAKTAIERMICADADLTVLDTLLFFTYEEQHSRLVAMEESGQLVELERTQQEWLTRRDICSNPRCLTDAYRERVAAIDGVTAAGVPDAPEKGDFNFDGYQDFALYNGANGPYGSQTYNVYLYSPEKRTFVLSEAFSKLTLHNINFFKVDTKRKRLSTFSKDGCCYHEASEYVVRNNRPVEVFREIREHKDSYAMVTEMKLVGGKLRTTKRYRCQIQDSARQARGTEGKPT